MFLPCLSVAVAGLAMMAEAQTRTTPSSTSSTSSTAVMTHTIAVGANGFKFEPNNVTAAVGDWIEWNFYPGGHGVAQSDFERACIPWELAGTNRPAGFFSGIQKTNVYTANGPKYRVRINDTVPIFYYCVAPGSCYKEHMIGAINPNSTWTLEKQQEAVGKAEFQVTPGETLPSETGEPTPTPTATSGPGQNSSNSNTSSNSDSHALSPGAIAGIAIGAFAALVLAGALIWLCGRHSKSDRGNRESMNRNSFPVGGMSDTKYASPSSPGQSTFTSNPHYSLSPGSEPYRPGTQSPPLRQHFAEAGSPPMSPGSHPTHGTYQNLNQYASVMLTDGSQPYYDHSQHHTPVPKAPPVELPSSNDPGNSPIPPYNPGRQMSWSAGQETGYRPGPK